MGADSFKDCKMNKYHPDWVQCIHREDALYHRPDDIRSEFSRDMNRILHSLAYRRLKHKTQVFFATANDHICTRIEHVNHVESISYTIASYLGLNTELTSAIALGHDLGHAPFGHEGERVLNDIIKAHLEQGESYEKFWHEKNSLYFVDAIETLTSPQQEVKNLDLTYAVRDGIICHCGEIDENHLRPRKEAVNLSSIKSSGQYAPYTWEGCIVKLADKIAYLGRDIEDAIALEVLAQKDIQSLNQIIERTLPDLHVGKINNTNLIHRFITDLCHESSPEKGICLPEATRQLMDEIKRFNYTFIYNNERLNYFRGYCRLVLETIFQFLYSQYEGQHTIEAFEKADRNMLLIKEFKGWLKKYGKAIERKAIYKNKAIYDLSSKKDYKKAIIDFMAGMTDQFAIKVFNDIIQF